MVGLGNGGPPGGAGKLPKQPQQLRDRLRVCLGPEGAPGHNGAQQQGRRRGRRENRPHRPNRRLHQHAHRGSPAKRPRGSRGRFNHGRPKGSSSSTRSSRSRRSSSRSSSSRGSSRRSSRSSRGSRSSNSSSSRHSNPPGQHNRKGGRCQACNRHRGLCHHRRRIMGCRCRRPHRARNHLTRTADRKTPPQLGVGPSRLGQGHCHPWTPTLPAVACLSRTLGIRSSRSGARRTPRRRPSWWCGCWHGSTPRPLVRTLIVRGQKFWKVGFGTAGRGLQQLKTCVGAVALP